MEAFREPTGYITDLVDGGDTTAELKRLRVDPDHQRRGFGAAILDALTERARELGYESSVLDTTSGQPGAQRFFETNGFRRIGRDQIEGPDGAIELLLYRGNLDDL